MRCGAEAQRGVVLREWWAVCGRCTDVGLTDRRPSREKEYEFAFGLIMRCGTAASSMSVCPIMWDRFHWPTTKTMCIICGRQTMRNSPNELQL